MGWGRVYQDYLWVAELMKDPLQFVNPVGAGSPESLTITHKLYKPAPTPPTKNDRDIFVTNAIAPTLI